MIRKWKAKNIDGKVIIEDKDLFNMFLSTLPEKIVVTVSKLTRQRSVNQNSYYWGVVVHLISEELGYTPDEVHELLKLEHNKKTIMVGKDEKTIGLSTASLTTVEFEQYISRIVAWASFELGVVIPNPDEVNVNER